MSDGWKRAFQCGGYCADHFMEIYTGQFPPEGPTKDKGILITTGLPTDHGWVSTLDPRWSYGGKIVWLCPDCQARWREEQDNG